MIDHLAKITLAGPAGSAVLDRDTDRPMAILRDGTGQVRGILQNPVAGFTASDGGALMSEPGIEVLLSRGIPER